MAVFLFQGGSLLAPSRMNSYNEKYFLYDISAHRVLQVQGGGDEGVLPVLRVPTTR